MLQQLNEILNENQFDELMKAILNHQKFNLDLNGLKIAVTPNEDNFQIVINYDRSEKIQANNLTKDFQKYLSTLDDNIFIEVCEFIGPEKVKQINKCINSDTLESVRSGINKFKISMRKFLISKINYYQTCLNNLEK